MGKTDNIIESDFTVRRINNLNSEINSVGFVKSICKRKESL